MWCLPSALRGVAEGGELGLALKPLECAGLCLARLRDRQTELARSLLDRVLAFATGAVAQVDDLHLCGRQLLQEPAHAAGVVGLHDVRLYVGVLDRDERPKRGLAILAHTGVK